jgi:DNA helicase-2/ATP-dependent DNA helicase PcrA
VGLTRARKRVFVSYAAVRQIHGQWQPTLPSRFLSELPEEHSETQAEPGLYPRADQLGSDWSIGARPKLEAVRMALAARASLAPPAPPRRTPDGGFAAGDRIFHQKFGHGTVRTVDGSKLAIAFDKAGDKMVMDSFVEKA